MLRYYKFKNFHTFAEETVISLMIGKAAAARGWESRSADGERISTATAIFGANASGKTAALMPLAFLNWFINESFESGKDEPIYVDPHAMHVDEPTVLEAEAEDVDGNLWRYFVELTRKRVLREELHKKPLATHDGSATGSSPRYSYVFKREWIESEKAYQVKQKGFGLDQRQAVLARENASLIATAAQFGVPLAKRLSSVNFATNVISFGRMPRWMRADSQAAAFYMENEDLRIAAVDFMRRFDMGLKDVEVSKEAYPTKDGAPMTRYRMKGLHVTSEGQEFSLPMEQESSGTRSAISLLADLLPVALDGGIAVIDELENDLHPDLIYPILKMFESDESNPRRAQLIFTSHATKVMEFLGKPNLYFVEKRDCASEVYRGDDIVGLRSDDNIRAKYEAGALGAVPVVE